MVDRCKKKTGTANAQCVHFEGHPGPHVAPNQRLKAVYPDLWAQLENGNDEQPIGMPGSLLVDLHDRGLLDFVWDNPKSPGPGPAAPVQPEMQKPVSAADKKKLVAVVEKIKAKTTSEPTSEPTPEPKPKRRKKKTTSKKRPAKKVKS